MGCVFRICDRAGGIDVDSHGDADCAVDGIAGALGNLGHVATDHVPALYIAVRGSCRGRDWG